MQRRLQQEAQLALALARPMARMQVEVERQILLQRRSPVHHLVSLHVCVCVCVGGGGRCMPHSVPSVLCHVQSPANSLQHF